MRKEAELEISSPLLKLSNYLEATWFGQVHASHSKRAGNFVCRVTRWTVVVILIASASGAQRAQQPTPTPRQTGRSYSVAESPKVTPPAGPTAPSPVTFSDVTSSLKVDFKHSASPTARKYLLETMGGGVAILDYDNDGLHDIVVAQSHVLDTIEQSVTNLKYRQPPLLIRNLGKSFTNVSATAGAAFNVPIAARGAAFGDFNNDGQVDVVIGIVDGAPLVLRNNGTKNHWLGIRLIGDVSNRDGIGTRITVNDSSGGRRIFDTSTSGSYLSSNDPRTVIGLGSSDRVRTVEIRWPSGRVKTLVNPQVDRYLAVMESK